MEILGEMINVQELIFSTINFLILVALLFKFLYKPVLKMLDDRKQAIADSLNAATAAREESEAVKASLQAEIIKAREQAETLIATAQKASEDAKKDIMERAQIEAQALSQKARAEIDREKTEAIAQLKKEVASLAVAAATKILKGELDAETQKQITDKYIQEVGQIQ